MRAERDEALGADCEVAVLARAPVPGEAKTRLIPALGAAGAAALQARLIELTLAKAAALEGARVSLWLAGDSAALPAAARGVPLRAQQGEDLGARMDHAAREALARAARVLLIGTDCPALTPRHLRAARDALAHHDVAVQPADDGGYVLIGLNAPQPALFRGIAWGSASVFPTTLRRIAEAGLRAAVLPSLPDLDTPDDLARARAAGWL